MTTDNVATLPRISYERDNVLDLAPALRVLYGQQRVVRVRTMAGDEAWLVNHHDDVRALLGDNRLGRSHPDPERAPRAFNSALGGPIGNYGDAQAGRMLMRKLLAASFSPRRMEAMQPRVAELVNGLLDDLLAAGSPADLHEHVSWPLPVLVICELLGVPAQDRHRFRGWSEATLDMADMRRSMTAWGELTGYMRKLTERKRQEPGTDVISDLIAVQDENQLSDDMIVQMAAGLLAGGFETTVARIDLGTVLFLTNPDQRAAMHDEPELISTAVEEILRLAAPGGGGLPRYAHEDIVIGDVTIHRGDAVLVDPNMANRDPEVFADPNRFDIRRSPNPHLSFGYGARSCTGASLGRVELRTLFGTLFERIPTLRLAGDVSDLRLRNHLLTGGLEALPVDW